MPSMRVRLPVAMLIDPSSNATVECGGRYAITGDPDWPGLVRQSTSMQGSPSWLKDASVARKPVAQIGNPPSTVLPKG